VAFTGRVLKKREKNGNKKRKENMDQDLKQY